MFSAAHYIKGHPKCGGVHGHTYIVRQLTIDIFGIDDMGISIDFGIIKDYFKNEWDHRFIVPKEDYHLWREITKELKLLDNLKPVKYTTAEWFNIIIKSDLIEMLNKRYPGKLTADMYPVSFILLEGPKQGVLI